MFRADAFQQLFHGMRLLLGDGRLKLSGIILCLTTRLQGAKHKPQNDRACHQGPRQEEYFPVRANKGKSIHVRSVV